MAYVPVPKDLSKIKTKVAFNLTKRQIICFAAALAMGLPLFFLLKDSAGTSMAAFAMIVVMLPCFLLAMYEKHGQPLEVVIKNVIQTKFIRPKERPYQTENFYAVIEKQVYPVFLYAVLERLHQQPPRVRTGENRRTGQKGIC